MLRDVTNTPKTAENCGRIVPSSAESDEDGNQYWHAMNVFMYLYEYASLYLIVNMSRGERGVN